jgi:hypothetical protein
MHIIIDVGQATACVCQSVEVRGCAGMHCFMELSGGVVQRNLKPAQAEMPKENAPKGSARRQGLLF